MTTVDYVVVGILTLSALLSLLRGFIREAISLAAWSVAGGVAFIFSPPMVIWLAPYITIVPLRLVAAFAILFIVTLVLCSVVGYIVGQLIARHHVSGTDRLVGLFFGLARGVLIVSVVVWLGNFTPFAQDGWWRESKMINQFQHVATWLESFLPATLTKKS
ncbi:MAG: membrane protein required for colicin V production [Halothiobacillaceae bacterium]|nr:MAG: membrane protein required for colicin V production [Halothiobacillaceae bacterium]